MEADAKRQFAFFRNSLRADGGFDVLAEDGTALPRSAQELHTTTRMVHSYALGKAFGEPDCDDIIDAGLRYLQNHHYDQEHGGYLWSVNGSDIIDETKLAYGHVFVLLAASSAHAAGHPDAKALIADISNVIDTHFWDSDVGLLSDEFTRDWKPFSNYRGYNANMHGTEAFLNAFEATGEQNYLDKAGRIISFFVDQMASEHQWRLPEHYTDQWVPDTQYEGNPMFRPFGTTPGHSFEMGRLVLQHWDLTGRVDKEAPEKARQLIETAFNDAWLPNGGFAYTLDFNGDVRVSDRYWWPVTEAIGAYSALLKINHSSTDEARYRQLWQCASDLFIDHKQGAWFPEIDRDGHPTFKQFNGKPDIYHALQADLLPLAKGISRLMDDLS